MFVFALIQSEFFKFSENFWNNKLISIVFGLIILPTLFYTVNGIFGKTSGLFNILLFFYFFRKNLHNYLV